MSFAAKSPTSRIRAKGPMRAGVDGLRSCSMRAAVTSGRALDVPRSVSWMASRTAGSSSISSSDQKALLPAGGQLLLDGVEEDAGQVGPSSGPGKKMFFVYGWRTKRR